MWHHTLISLVVAIALTGCGTPKPDFSDASPDKRVQLEAAVASHSRLAAMLDRCRSSPVEVFEGLPHPKWERQALATESRRPDTFENHDFRFYRPAMPLPQEARGRLLHRILSTSTYQPWRGPKSCGGFHPDLLLRFTTRNGPVELHLCFRCAEAMFFEGSSFILVDMDEDISDSLQQIQQTHRDKRPARQPLTSTRTRANKARLASLRALSFLQ